MKIKGNSYTEITNFLQINSAASASNDGHRCMIAPHPELKKKILSDIKKLKADAKKIGLFNKIKIEELSHPGLNDGLIFPGVSFPLGTSLAAARSATLDRAPLRGTLRVIVVLVDFSDQPMTKSKKHFQDLFFSGGRTIPTGSLKEYYEEVSGGLISIAGEVVGPFRLPKTKAQYANSASGMGTTFPNARTMAKDAAVKANPSVNFAAYDNNGDNLVDAFVVVHAGTGAETNNNPNDIWSHKWVLDPGPYDADGTTKIYSYLTVPEDCNLGVCAHELGHLLFGFPDLYDTDNSSEGIGDWCLMASGSWNGGGLTPAHPSAWCKCNQGWVTEVIPTSNQKSVSLQDVKTGKKVLKLWKDGAPGKEHFLVENRQRTKFDSKLPGSGLLIWHIDNAMSGNSNEAHYRVALMQADGRRDLEAAANRGDSDDAFPGKLNKKSFSSTTNPGSKSYAGLDSKVAIKNISDSAATMTMDVSVK